ncbi:MAG: 23S rRNA methyltransferase [Neisseria sp.]|nr:23S rRNA methyltransferase [Neisseria sp.]
MSSYVILGVLAAVCVVLIILVMIGKSKSASRRSHASDEDAYYDDEDDDQSDQEDDDEWDEEESKDEGQGQEWEWDSGSPDMSTASVSAQEVDPLTEYQVYKQFGYEDKAAVSLAGYLNNLNVPAPKKLVQELTDMCLRVGDIDLLSATLDKHANILTPVELMDYVKAGLGIEPNHLGLRVLAESKLNWDMQEVARQIGEKTGLESSDADTSDTHYVQEVSASSEDPLGGKTLKRISRRTPLIIGKAEVADMTDEEMSAVIGFVKPEKSAKLLKNQVNYEVALQQYNKAIQKADKPAALLIDALKLDYQHADVNEFAEHLWKLYYALGSNGRQVKERMLGWGYSLGQHEVFDNLEKSPNEQQIREIGLKLGYLPASRQSKLKYRELVQRNDSVLNESTSPAELALKEVESLLMYGQLEQAIATLEQSVLQYPQESQLYIMLFDLYERSEDWGKLEQFLKVLREREANLPEEVVLAMSQLLQRVNRKTNK